jgi:cyclic beta-1,2-glucan synthetase
LNWCWATGARRTLPHIVTEADSKTGALLARNSYNTDFNQRVVFLDCSEGQRTVTGDRAGVSGAQREAVQSGVHVAVAPVRAVGAGWTRARRCRRRWIWPRGSRWKSRSSFGCGRDLPTRALVGTFPRRGAGACTALAGSGIIGSERWAVQVETPDPYVNFLVNGWLLYQTLACRVWGRSGFYQSGGAFGFRDQLQDVAALIHAEPAIVREQVLRCAARQFREGDVQHWWHPPAAAGACARASAMIICGFPTRVPVRRGDGRHGSAG